MKSWTLGIGVSTAMLIACSQNNLTGTDTADTADTGIFSSCFTAGTRVLTERGPVSIESIVPGDRVWSWSTADGTPVLRTVLKRICGESKETYRIQAGEQVIAGVTAEHPFWIPASKQWKNVDTLSAGMGVLCWHGQHESRIVTIETHTVTQHDQPVAVYTLSVEGPEHNFFAEGVLVHNKSEAVECWKISSPDERMVEFGEVPKQTEVERAIRLTVRANYDCDWLGEEERLLHFELDNPDDVFSLPITSIDLSLAETDTPIMLRFTPTEAAAYEAQLKTTAHHAAVFTSLKFQIFGRGIDGED